MDMSVYEFENKVSKYINDNKMLTVNDKIIVGVSGGADSVALFTVLVGLKEKYNLSLKVVHINHGLRKEAVEEAHYVEKLCRENNVEFVLKNLDVASVSKRMGLGTEETGRILRYMAFAEEAGEDGKIAIAHNLNDKAETMLFFLCRGTGPRGMASIKAVTGNRIRPLLCVTREEIEDYLSKKEIEFYTDSSNLTDLYTRNRIRNEVLPLLAEKVNPRSMEHISQAAESIEALDDYVSSVADTELTRITVKSDETSYTVLRDGLNGLHKAVLRECIKHMIDKLVPGNKDITLTHIDSVISLAASSENASVNLPYAIVATCEYNNLTLSKGLRSEKVEDIDLDLAEGTFEVDGLGMVKVSVFDKTADFVLLQKEYTKYFDCDKINIRPTLRHRREKDFLTINEKMGRKKLKSFFIDRKYPVSKREETFLVADGSHVMWVIGDRISEYYKVDEKTKRIISIEVIKEDR